MICWHFLFHLPLMTCSPLASWNKDYSDEFAHHNLKFWAPSARTHNRGVLNCVVALKSEDFNYCDLMML